jgi:hypothetical protein
MIKLIRFAQIFRENGKCAHPVPLAVPYSFFRLAKCGLADGTQPRSRLSTVSSAATECFGILVISLGYYWSGTRSEGKKGRQLDN